MEEIKQNKEETNVSSDNYIPEIEDDYNYLQ